MEYVYFVEADFPSIENNYRNYVMPVGIFETPYDAKRACVDYEESFRSASCRMYRYKVNGREGGELVEYDEDLKLFFVLSHYSMKKEVIE